MKSRLPLFSAALALGAGCLLPAAEVPAQAQEALPPRREAAISGGTGTPERKGFVLRSPAVAEGGALPVEFTGDGAGVSPPLAWSGAPAETRSYAVIMHHLDPEGQTKWYWTLYNIPAEVRSLPKDVQDIGVLGNNSVNRRLGYAPPHSKGPGAKTYVLTVYALAAPLQISVPPAGVNREVLLAAMKQIILNSAELKVICTRADTTGNNGKGPGAAGKKKGERKQ
jgi:Raf kinase inhibitor-like YbhB/YbcL family protein